MAELFDVTLGFIGAGNMGEAFIGAVLRSGLLPADRVSVADVDARRLADLHERYAITVARDNGALFETCSVVVLAVKPQQMPAVLRDIRNCEGYRLPQRKLLISIAAGFTIRQMEQILYSALDEEGVRNRPIIRVMPNTPALVLSAVSGMSPNRCVTVEDARAARIFLQAVGEVFEFEEQALDAVTALSGSGPAYVFYLVESMAAAGVQVGLEAGTAAAMAAATLRGAARLLEASAETPAALRRKVTSPGGTTAAAIEVFEQKGFKAIVAAAIAAAARRAKELSGEPRS
ncbi:MAG: pyrroline-5-carboxylate reductase [Desulfobacterales bacterium]